jgi:hypothetical protein
MGNLTSVADSHFNALAARGCAQPGLEHDLKQGVMRQLTDNHMGARAERGEWAPLSGIAQRTRVE